MQTLQDIFPQIICSCFCFFIVNLFQHNPPYSSPVHQSYIDGIDWPLKDFHGYFMPLVCSTTRELRSHILICKIVICTATICDHTQCFIPEKLYRQITRVSTNISKTNKLALIPGPLQYSRYKAWYPMISHAHLNKSACYV